MSSLLLQELDHLLTLEGPELEDLRDADIGPELIERVESVCAEAYEGGEPEAEHTIHTVLNRIYQTQVTVPPPGRRTLEASSMLNEVRNTIEEAFLRSEEAKLADGLLSAAPQGPRDYEAWFFDTVHSHPAFTHPLYEEYLPAHATVDDLRYLLVQESTIDAATDDFIALVQLGIRGTPKLEMASNYWDEMGNGAPEAVHSTLFDGALRRFDISLTEPEVPLETEALVCGNLQLMLGLRRAHAYKAIGYFGVVEYMAPGRFTKLMEAWKGLGLGLEGADYHLVHIDADQEHAEGWFRNVIQPMVTADPAVVPDITRGALFRLNTSNRYLDRIFPNFPSRSGNGSSHVSGWTG